MVEQQHQENKTQVHIHKFDFSSWKTITGFVFMSTIAFCALLAIVNLREENSSLRTNDLKYRYIKMVGNIDDRLVYDLEELIYKDKEGKVLKEMKKQIEDYERAIELKIRAEEQARLNKAKSVKLDKQIRIYKKRG
ncbi:MAG: hypothetical protein SNI58_07265 [Rikenellaceae bacterium]